MQLTRYFCERDTEIDILTNPKNKIAIRQSEDVLEHITLIENILHTHPFITVVQDEQDVAFYKGFFFVSNTLIYFLSAQSIDFHSLKITEPMHRKALSEMLCGFFEKN